MERCRALVLYAYPLHPAGKPDRLRVEHLSRIAAPMLFFVGTRDPLSRMDLVGRWLRPLPNATIETIDGADHAFRVPRAAGRSQQSVLEAMVAATARWLRDGPGQAG